MAAGSFAVVDSSWELIDPNPDIHLLFSQFNETFFWGRLSSVYVQWSPRMTLCAGVCKYHGRNRECSVHLSKPLLSYRPRKDLVETLLHEMIHAYLFVVDGNRERESHGPKFHEHMYRINRLTGANITVYHSFHDEVNHFKTHWWKCNGPCQHRSPFYGIVKRSMNRAPGPNDFWYKDHQKNCGGVFTKIKEPSPKKAVKRKKEPTAKTSQKSPELIENKSKKITNYFTPTADRKKPATATITTIDLSPSPPRNENRNTTRNVGGGNRAAISSTDLSPTATQPKPTEMNTSLEAFSGRGFVLGSIGNNTGGGPSTSSGVSIPRNLFGASATSSGFSSSLFSSSNPIGGTSMRKGGGGTQPPRRGEHPLLAKWMQNKINH